MKKILQINSHFKKINILLLILLLIAIPAYTNNNQIKIIKYNNQGEFISYYDLVKQLNLDHSFDVTSGRAKFFKNNNFVTFNEGFAVALSNRGKIIRTVNPVLRNKKYELLIPLEMTTFFIQELYPGYKISINKGFLQIKKEKKQIKNNYVKKSKGKKEKIAFIIIDPGHGGKDPGAVSKNGKYEKDIVFSVANQLSAYLKTHLKGVRIYQTRKKDIFWELGARTEYANKKLKKGENGIFISIHANAALSPKVSGFETYFLSQNPTNEAARNTSALENNVVKYEKKKRNYNDVSYVEALMLTTEIQRESAILAKYVQGNLDKQISEFKSRGVKKADFFVLRGSLMPAILIETGYLTNKKECSYLFKKSYQQKIVKGIAQGIEKFILEYNKIE